MATIWCPYLARPLRIHIAFVNDEKFFKCEHCPIRTKTELALHYHVDIKHNVYWVVEEEVLNHPEENIYIESKKEDNIKAEPSDILEIKICDFCEKSFLTERGLLVHFSKTHKQEFKNHEEYKNKQKSDRE